MIEPHNEPHNTVFIVDDSEVIRDSLSYLLHSVAIATETFISGHALLDAVNPQRRGCLILDIRLPDMSGMDLALKLREHHVTLPIIFITAHGDIPMAVEAMRLGALDFIEKPFRDQDILDRVYQAFELDATQHRVLGELETIRRRLDQLTRREREVLECIVMGATNKAIAAQLHLSLRTVELYRANLMKKMSAASAAELVQMITRVRSG